MTTAQTHLTPAAPVQEQMWLVDEMDPDAAVYNESLSFELSGELSVAALEDAWNAMIVRHEMLRTVMMTEDERLWQCAVEPWRVHLDPTDFADLPSQEAREGVRAWAQELIEARYDIAARPPVRIGLARMARDRHVLVVAFHHAVIDAGSVALLFEELGAAYEDARAGHPPERTDPASSYVDFVHWHLEQIGSGTLHEERAAWVSELAKAEHVLEMPPDRPRPAVKSNHGDLVTFPFPRAIVPGLREFAARQRVTPFAALLGCLATLLYRHTRVEDMIVGVGCEGRVPGHERTIGPFSCMAPVHLSLSTDGPIGDQPVAEVTERARDAILELERRQFIPFRTLVSDVLDHRDPSRTPVVQVVFNAPPLHFAPDTFSGSHLRMVHIPRSRARFDFLINLSWLDDDIEATVEYDDNTYSPRTAQRIVQEFGAVVESVVTDTGTTVGGVPLGPPATVLEEGPGDVAQVCAALLEGTGTGPVVHGALEGHPREEALTSAAALQGVETLPAEDPTEGVPHELVRLGCVAISEEDRPPHGYLLPVPGGTVALLVDPDAADADRGRITASSVHLSVQDPCGGPAAVEQEGVLAVAGSEVGEATLRFRTGDDGVTRWRLIGGVRPANLGESVAKTPTERYLTHLVEEKLDLAEGSVGPGDDFFGIGGHSMAASRLVQSLEADFGEQVRLLHVFEFPLIRDLAATLESENPAIAAALAEAELLDDAELDALAGSVHEEDTEPVDGWALDGLTPTEEPFWLSEQFVPGSSLNTLALAFSVRGPVDSEALHTALSSVVERHDILRTTFESGPDLVPRRVVHETAPAAFTHVEFDRISGAEREHEVTRLYEAEGGRGYDVGELPLLRLTLATLSPDEHLLILSCHHLVMDYWCVTRVLMPEISTFYRCAVEGTDVPDLPQPLSSSEVVRAALEREHSRQARNSAQYWRSRLADVPPLRLPTDHERPAEPSFEGAVGYFGAPPELSSQLAEFTAERGVTAFIVCAAALAGVLARWSGEQDVHFLTPAENRVDLASATTMGAFVNVLMLRFDVPVGSTWDELLRRTRTTVLDGYAHQSFPGTSMLQAAGRDSYIIGGSGTYVTLNLFQGDSGVDLVGTHVGDGRILPNRTAGTDLELTVLDQSKDMRLEAKYRTRLWERETVDRFLHEYRYALEELITDPRLVVRRGDDG